MRGGVRDSVSAGGVADRDAREAEESDTSDGAEGWMTQTGVVAAEWETVRATDHSAAR